jgi:hypothetical protein
VPQKNCNSRHSISWVISVGMSGRPGKPAFTPQRRPGIIPCTHVLPHDAPLSEKFSNASNLVHSRIPPLAAPTIADDGQEPGRGHGF